MPTPKKPHNYDTDQHLNATRPEPEAQPEDTFNAKQLAAYDKARLEAKSDTGQKGGRVSGVVGKIRNVTENFNKLIDFWAEVAFTGEYQGKAFGNRERIQCSEMLATRGMGKPVEARVLVDARNVNADGEVELSNEQLTRLVYALAPPPGSPVPLTKRVHSETPDYEAQLIRHPAPVEDALILEAEADAPEKPLDRDVADSFEAAGDDKA